MSSHPQHSRRRASVPPLNLLEIVVLAPLAAILALWVIPGAFGVEWSCVGAICG